MLMFGLRLGDDPRVVVTTTPKPIRIIRELIADPTTVITRGSTYDNRANLAPAFLQQIVTKAVVLLPANRPCRLLGQVPMGSVG